MRIDLLFSVELVVIICPKVFELNAAKHKVNSNEYRVRHRHRCTVLSAMRNQSVVLSAEEAIFVFFADFAHCASVDFSVLLPGGVLLLLRFPALSLLPGQTPAQLLRLC